MPPTQTGGLTAGIVLRGTALAYAYAFLSFYVEAKGLYGAGGLLPVDAHVANAAPWLKAAPMASAADVFSVWRRFPTLVPVGGRLTGLHTDAMLEVVSLAGVALSCVAMTWRRSQNRSNLTD